MNAWIWTALALVLLPAAVGWYILLRHVFARYLERHDARQIEQINAECVAKAAARAENGHQTAYTRKRGRRALGNAEIVRLTRSGPKAGT